MKIEFYIDDCSIN